MASPLHQSFSLRLPSGTDTFTITLDDIDFLQRSATWQALVNGVQLGAAALLLITLIFMTKPDKRRSFIFLCNAFALLLVVVRASLQLATLLGPLYNFYRWAAAYYANISPAVARISIAAELTSFLLTLAIELALAFQVAVVCCNLPAFRQWCVRLANAAVVLTAVSVRFALMVVNIRWSILHPADLTDYQWSTIGRLASAANITLVVCIALASIFFTTKLARAIHSRRTMGLTQFGPMQILFIMGFQTMLTPLLFTILTYWALDTPVLHSFVPVVVALSLPLSGMWATTHGTSVHMAAPDRRPFPSTGPSYGKTTASSTLWGSEASPPSHKTRFDADDVLRSSSPVRSMH